MSESNPPRGRPPLRAATASGQMQVRVSLAEKALYEEAAAAAGQSLSQWLLDAAAARWKAGW